MPVKSMVHLLLKLLAVLALAAALGSLSIANGALVDTESHTLGQTSYDKDILTNDLINLGQDTLASASGTLPFQAENINAAHDGFGGKIAGGANAYYILPPSATATLIFKLNVHPSDGGCANGYNITKIQSIAGWINENDASQNFTVSYQTVASAQTSTWIPLGRSFDNEVSDGADDATKTVIKDDSAEGIIARNVVALKFTYVRPRNAGSTVLHEIDVVGKSADAAPSTSTLSRFMNRICLTTDKRDFLRSPASGRLAKPEPALATSGS